MFIESWEIPGLLRGAVLAEPASIRRILGARRGGRIGIALSLLALVPYALSGALLPTVAAHAALSISGWYIQRSELRPRQYQRVCLWLVAPALALAAPLSLVLQDVGAVAAGAPGVAAGLAAHVRLVLYVASRAKD